MNKEALGAREAAAGGEPLACPGGHRQRRTAGWCRRGFQRPVLARGAPPPRGRYSTLDRGRGAGPRPRGPRADGRRAGVSDGEYGG